MKNLRKSEKLFAIVIAGTLVISAFVLSFPIASKAQQTAQPLYEVYAVKYATLANFPVSALVRALIHRANWISQ